MSTWVWLKSVTRRKSFRALLVFLFAIIVLHVVPVPPVGEPVESLAGEHDKFVIVEGVKIRYVEMLGYGDLTFVLLHGFGASVFSWREILNNLSNYGRVIAFDRPGFGLTERVDPASLSFNPYTAEGQARITYELLRKLNVSKAVIVGHSAGGGLALLIALEYPELVDAQYGPLIIRGFVSQLEQILYRAWYNKSKLTEGVIEGYKYPLRAKDWDKGLYWLMKYRGFPEISGLLKEVKAPILVIHGVNDEIVPLNSSLELVSLLSNESKPRLVIVGECGHLPHEEKPDEFLKIVKEFIEEFTR